MLLGLYRKEGTMSSFTVSSGNQNIVSLFSSLPGASNNSMGALTSTIAGLTTDYASIKNGSYGKVTKAYYAKQSDSSDKTESKSDKTSSKTKTDTMESTAAKAKSLENSIDSLSKPSLYSANTYNAEAVGKKAKNFVDAYNSAIKDSLSSSSMNVQNKGYKLASLTLSNEKALENIGISINSKDNTLALDMDKFKAASANDVKAVFGGNAGYAKDAAALASSITSAANSESATYTSNGVYNGIQATGNIFDSLF